MRFERVVFRRIFSNVEIGDFTVKKKSILHSFGLDEKEKFCLLKIKSIHILSIIIHVFTTAHHISIIP